MKRITLTRKGFREWLEGKPGGERVGWAGHTASCPIAEYLRHTEAKVPFVNEVYFRCNGIHKPMPNWGSKFIRKIDKAPSLSKVTARQALAVLEGKEPTDA